MYTSGIKRMWLDYATIDTKEGDYLNVGNHIYVTCNNVVYYVIQFIQTIPTNELNRFLYLWYVKKILFFNK